MRQYYYRMTECRAMNTRASECICWHDEGTGPVPIEREDYPKLQWRDMPHVEKEPTPQDYTRQHGDTCTNVRETNSWRDELNGKDRSIAMNRTTWLLADALGLIEPDADRVTLDIADTVGKALEVLRAPKQWRCFHCDELFTDRDKAREHFGRTEMAHPACTIDAAQFREMESYVQRAREEDTDVMRQRAQMQSDHAIALLREEEKGYALGIAHIRTESKPIVDVLIGLVRDTHFLLDNSEEREDKEDGIIHIVQQRDYERTSATLDVLEALPDDRPGYVLGPAGKAQWALRNLLGEE